MPDILKNYDELINATSNLIKSLKVYPKVFTSNETKKYHNFFDKALFNSLNQLDLIIGLKYLDLSQIVGNNLEANYFARVLILSSHEILNNVNIIIGVEIRNDIISKLGKEEVNKLDETVKEINKLKKSHLKDLKILRNNVLGHKLREGHQQAEMIVGINHKEIYDISNNIFNSQMKLLKHYLDILEKI